MTEVEIAQRMSDFDLGLKVLHLTDSMNLTDDELAAMEEAAQRLINGAYNDSFTGTPATNPSGQTG